MEDYKKHIKIIGTAAGNAIIPGFGGALIGGALGAMFDGSDDSEEERKAAEERLNSWYEIANNLSNFRLQDRKSIMFLSDEDIGLVWNEKYPGDCEIIYLPYSQGIPDGITLDDTHIEEGALYVYDPRNEYRYYKANEISQVLIKDKFREIKQIFESLGATQIDITFRAQKDEQHEYNSNNSQNVSGRYGAHRASVSHSGSRGGTNHTSDFRQLEIHKRCTGKTSHLNYNKCYWYQNDVILQDEVRSIKAGSTLESNFVDTTKSYCSLTATRMDKIEAEYEYMESIGVSGMAQWDNSTMQEISQELVWDVHVAFDYNNLSKTSNNMLESNFEIFEHWFESADAEDLKPYVYEYDFSENYDSEDEIQERWMRIVDQYAHFLSDGIRGAQVDYKEAYRLLNITVNVGRRIVGLCNLAEMYELNKGVNLDYPKARELYERVLFDAIDKKIEEHSPYAQFAKERLYAMKERTNDFCMRIEDVFNISDRGIVVTGQISSGVVSIGDELNIIGSKGSLRTKAIGIEMFKQILSSGEEGDNIGLFIEDNISVSIINKGDLVCSVHYDTKLQQTTAYNNITSSSILSESEQEYLEEYKCMLEDGEIGPRERRSLDRHASRLGLSAERVAELEAYIGNGQSLSEEEQEYLDEYREILADGDIRDRDRRALERLAQRNGISASRAAELEKLA